MRLTSLFLAVGLFAACQTEGVGPLEIDAGIDADDGTGPQRGGEGRIPDAGIPGDTKVATPDSLPTVSPDTLPPKDALNLDAMTRAERCATGRPEIYAYAWPTACVDLTAWIANCKREGVGVSESTDPVACAWTLCTVVKLYTQPDAGVACRFGL